MEHMENESDQVASLSDEITKMCEEDQSWRDINKKGTVNFEDCPDAKNTARMKEIVSKFGWPSISKFGEKVSNEAWLLVQHADYDKTGFQEKCLELMQSLPEGEVSKRNLAYLEDRVRVNTRRPQLYGTQFRKDGDGKFTPQPIEDPDHLEDRRKEMGLEPFAENFQRVKKIQEEMDRNLEANRNK